MYTTILAAMFVPVLTLGQLSIRYNENGIVPQNRGLLVDDSSATCTSFMSAADDAGPKYTMLRVRVLNTEADALNVTLIGSNLGCGSNIHLSPLTAPQTNHWTGLWLTCPLLRMVSDGDKEMCTFECRCFGGCEEIQIAKRPRIASESIWTLCSVSFTLIASCLDAPKHQSGIYPLNVTFSGQTPTYKDVYCDMETDGGGWMLLVRRMDGSENFTREWQDYKEGFGSLDGEFWAGNELIHQLAINGGNYSVRVDLESHEGEKIFAVYDSFWIGPESENYTIHVDGYSINSTAGDSLRYADQMMFSTLNRDNDENTNQRNCAEEFKGGWWYRNCCLATLTALYGPYPTVPSRKGIKWESSWNFTTFAKYATMMVRRN